MYCKWTGLYSCDHVDNETGCCASIDGCKYINQEDRHLCRYENNDYLDNRDNRDYEDFREFEESER